MAHLDEIKTIGVLGAGQMGGGIAQVAAGAGFDVVLVDASLELADRGQEEDRVRPRASRSRRAR